VGARPHRARPARRRRGLRAAVGDADHAGDPVRRLRVAGWPGCARRDRPFELRRDRARVGGSHARARVVLRRVAHRPRCAAPHGRAAGPSARDRPTADDCPGRRGRCCGVRPVDRHGSRDPGGRAGANGRRARAGGRHRAARAAADPTGTQRGERSQRRNLRAAAVRGGRDRRRRIGHLRRPQPRHPAAGGDRLRRARRRGRRPAHRPHRQGGRTARPDRESGRRSRRPAPHLPTASPAGSTDPGSSQPLSPAWSSA
jgi:hypothetical protein